MMFDENIHPFSLISSSQSFQNIDRINRVFSALFVPDGLWKTIQGMQIRFKDRPDQVASWSASDLEGLRRTFDLRHEIVHDPPAKFIYTQQIHDDLLRSYHMIFGTEFVLPSAIEKNKRQ